MFGQCTWYAVCSLWRLGVDPSENIYWTGGLANWLSTVEEYNCPDVFGESNANAIATGSIAIWEGHVVFIDYVEYDKSGAPLNIYYTEANYGHKSANLESGVYYEGFDCIVKVDTFDSFINRSKGLVGFIQVI